MGELVAFNPASLPTNEATKLARIQGHIALQHRNGTLAMFRIAQYLAQGKAILEANKQDGLAFDNWAEKFCGISRANAHRYLRIHKHFNPEDVDPSKLTCIKEVSITIDALLKLTHDPDPQEALAEAVEAAGGETVDTATATETVEKRKPKAKRKPSGKPKTKKPKEPKPRKEKYTPPASLDVIDADIQKLFGKMIRRFNERATATGGQGAEYQACKESLGGCLADWKAWKKRRPS